MIFFGWGRKSRNEQISPTQALVLSFGYFHLFWLFRVSFGLRYALATLTEQGWATRPLSDEEAAALDAPSRLTLHWWWRWGLLVLVGGVVTLVVATSLAGR